MMKRIVFLVSIGLIGAACGDGEQQPAVSPCEGVVGTCVEIAPGPDVQQVAQTALIEAQPGDVIGFVEGVFEFDRDLSLDVDGVTIRGAGPDNTILSFTGQIEGAQGVLVTADEFTIENIAIEDTPGDGLKVEGTTGVYMRNVRVEWTGGPSPDNGAYGLYPVQCTNVLIEDSVVIGASDAGVYVGQSENIIVRRNRAERNVAGIEIENSNGADVYDNVATDNTGGVLVFNLPGLDLTNGAGTRVFNNTITGNNTDNFAPPGGIIGELPRGVGVVLLAAHQVEIFGNEIGEHDSTNIAISSYLVSQNDFEDMDYDPYVDTIDIHDNTLGPSGDNLDASSGLSAVALQALLEIQQVPVMVPDILFFGYINPDKADPANPRLLLPEFNVCLRNNGDGDFANLDLGFNYEMVTTDLSPHDCEHPSPAAISIPGVE